MTAPLFFTGPGALEGAGVGDVIRVLGDEARHAAVVRRIGAGETVQVADGSGRVAVGEVVAAARDELTVRVAEIGESPVPATRFVLMQALAKGGRDEQAVESATELGVDGVVPWQAARSIVQWRGDKAEKARRKWESLVLAASKQSRRPTVPAVEPVVSGGGAVSRAGAADALIVLHEDATRPLREVELPDAGEVLLVVGPEGGISPEELAAFEAAGGVTARLGPTVLRASSAGPAALAILLAREW
ncbi:16S rRNA (uracil(1498)-N(3))-methyltransferase [Flexivirga sp. ID2601S]|uniref:Ribosomal RNA small subunit methyltransferase E n=1 Tax=Flexivirga aerilata TaxID=1656889 RepID=A0A849AL03_9MICO|nr:16S rRNA (uracil(1498)-N(3))-methyltransferase [Flexivirga aerilata]